jgi:hypothetical protein
MDRDLIVVQLMNRCKCVIEHMVAHRYALMMRRWACCPWAT